MMYYSVNSPMHDPNDLFRPFDIEFEEEGHKYSIKFPSSSGYLRLGVPSVNEIINAVFGDKYSKVPEDKLRTAQKRGTEVHREIKEYLVKGENGVSAENLWFRNEIEKNFQGQKCYCENYIYADTGHNGEKFCGTIDTFWMSGLLVDYKTSYRLDKHSTKIQLNMYAYAIKHYTQYKVNKLEAWHFTSRGLKRVEFKIETDKYVENIVRAYYEGRCFNNDKDLMEFYQKNDGELPEKSPETTDELLDACKRIKDVDEMIDKLKWVREKCVEKVKSEMERLDQVEMDISGMDMKLTYIPSSIRYSLDGKKVLGFLGDEVYQKCLKKSEVKAHIRVNYKKEK